MRASLASKHVKFGGLSVRVEAVAQLCASAHVRAEKMGVTRRSGQLENPWPWSHQRPQRQVRHDRVCVWVSCLE